MSPKASSLPLNISSPSHIVLSVIQDPHVDCYSMADIRDQLGLDRQKLIALALLLGCDYVPKGVMGVGKEHGCQLMKQLGGGMDVLQRFERWAEGTMATDSSLGRKFITFSHISSFVQFSDMKIFSVFSDFSVFFSAYFHQCC